MTRRKRSLSEEDRRLWASVARQAVPMKGRSLDDLPAPLPDPAPAAKPAPGGQAKPATGMSAALKGQRMVPMAIPAALHPIERPTRRKIAKGRLAIDARIDLHEMTQSAAHAALSRFLAQAQAMGLRHVLVITGRGMPGGSRGILRRVVPQWFASAPFRSLVSGFDSAERHHGGEGALYVRIRRLR
ncbi:Smr/MutS family protein [Jiella mangrovi]|uniref:Smr/MutS family protein n=1 Tax=Jiella mangrovi TaxID=2821407 RepID=A0ABS4BM83_9HYPH|nr:Smr/MutS family protein [Jiella mangrovi]MBP0617270.1 Smr/MutS family protein [Jiella mangrovi]